MHKLLTKLTSGFSFNSTNTVTLPTEATEPNGGSDSTLVNLRKQYTYSNFFLNTYRSE